MLQHRRPRLQSLEVSSSLTHEEVVAAVATTTTTNTADPHYDEETPRRKQLSLRTWVKINRRTILLRYISAGIVVFLVVVCMVWLLGIYVFTSQQTNKANNIAVYPYPPSNIQISAIVMNHARPYLLQHSKLLPVLLNHPTVSEILILHTNPQTAFTNNDLQQQHLGTALPFHKIQHIDANIMNRELGLAIRFHYCSTSTSNPWILHVDDDMELEPTAINAMVAAMMNQSQRIVGHYGRSYNLWRAPLRYGYYTKDIFGDHVEVVLTKLLLLEQRICVEFEKRKSLMDDMIQESHPLWNGEDIFVNLVANQYYGVQFAGPYNNYAMRDIDVWDANIDLYHEKAALQQQQGRNSNNNQDEVSISGNMDRNRIWNVSPITFWRAYMKAQEHTAYRGRLWYRAKRRLYGV